MIQKKRESRWSSRPALRLREVEVEGARGPFPNTTTSPSKKKVDVSAALPAIFGRGARWKARKKKRKKKENKTDFSIEKPVHWEKKNSEPYAAAISTI